MTVKWDMQQKHGSPPRIMWLFWRRCNSPSAFYSPQHGGYKLFCVCKASLPACSLKTNGCREKWGECSEMEHVVKWTAAKAKLKITYMHHGRMKRSVWDYKMQRGDEDTDRWRRMDTTITNLGEISHPCCMKAPRENHRLLKIPKSFGGSGGLWGSLASSFSSRCHSYGLKRLTRKSTTLTPI